MIALFWPDDRLARVALVAWWIFLFGASFHLIVSMP